MLAAVCFLLISLGLPGEVGNAADAINQIPNEVYEALSAERPSAVELLNQVKTGVPMFMVIPLILVLITAYQPWHVLE